MKKLIFNLSFIFCLLFIFTSDSFASGALIKDYFQNSNSTLQFEKASSQIYTILRTFGLVLAVCLIVTIAISYMVSTPNKRAILKERLVYYVSGVIFLVAGIGFLGWYEQFAKEVGDFSGSVSTYNALKEQTNNLAQEIRDLNKEKNELQKQRDEADKRYRDFCNTAENVTINEVKLNILDMANEQLKEVNRLDSQISQLTEDIANKEQRLGYINKSLSESFEKQDNTNTQTQNYIPETSPQHNISSN